VFYWKGAIFEVSGKLKSGLIATVILGILIVVQVAFAFANYAYKQMQFSFVCFDKARVLFSGVNWNEKDTLDEQIGELPEEIDQVYLADADGKLVYSRGLPAEETPSWDPLERYVFPFGSLSVGMHISHESAMSALRRNLLDLLTVLVVSLFFCFELVLILQQYIQRKVALAETGGEKRPQDALLYLRQIAFLFYFGSRMAVTFIPVLAKKLIGAPGSDIAASIPQSAETLLTCVAIFITSEIIIRKGWKIPFVLGLLIVAGGTCMSAFAPSLVFFIAARAIAGLGYGFCWMTLRNIVLLGDDDGARAAGFALLNAGLYAGINCGSVMGAILAEAIGYANVLVIAAGLTILCVFSVMGLKNARIQRNAAAGASAKEARRSGSRRADVLAFLALLILPSCIVGAYSSYYLPVYAIDSGRPIADVGRAQLLYGLMIVYIAPKLSAYLRQKIGDSLGINVLYCVILAGSLILSGLVRDFSIVFLCVICIGMADGFGFGAQNNFFLAMPFVARLSSSRALSWLSFLKKMAEMLGPICFALALGFSNGTGILVMGIAFLIMAALAGALRIRRT
jgi:MFS family permease